MPFYTVTPSFISNRERSEEVLKYNPPLISLKHTHKRSKLFSWTKRLWRRYQSNILLTTLSGTSGVGTRWLFWSNGTYAKVRASLAAALLRGKSIRRLYESLWFVPCLLAVCLLLKRFFSSLEVCWVFSNAYTKEEHLLVFSWPVIGEGPELLDAEGRSSIAPLRRGTCRKSNF